jgi:hypothetical protein
VIVTFRDEYLQGLFGGFRPDAAFVNQKNTA